MSRTSKQPSLLTISIIDPDGVDREYRVVSRGAQAAVKGLLDRLAQLRRDGEEDLIPMDDVLRSMEVPEEHRDICEEFISDHLEQYVGSPPETSCLHGWKLIPRDIVREYLPWPYKGSWLEREAISWEMSDDLGDDSLNLLNLADLVEQLAGSVGAADKELGQAEASGILNEIAQYIRAHTPDVCHEHDGVPQKA